MDESLVVGLIRDVEETKGRQTVHERECALRYQQLDENTKVMKDTISAIAKDVSALRDQGNHAAWSANWKAWMVAGTVGTILVGALTWSLGQLYALQPYRASPAQVQTTQ